MTSRSVVEPLHPTHDIGSFNCSTEQDLYNHTLRRYYEYAEWVVGQRVLVSSTGTRVTGYLSLIDMELDIEDDAKRDGLFIAMLAVSDERRGHSDAAMLLQHARRSRAAAERARGRPYWAIVVQPGANEKLRDAAEASGFQSQGNGYWAKPLPEPA